MMSRAPYDMTGSYNKQRDDYIDGERSINMYLFPQRANQNKAVMVPASGHANPVIVGVGPIRAQFVFKDQMYVVSDNNVYQLDSLLVPTLIGSLNTVSGYVGITANEKEVIFVDGVDGWIYDTIAVTFTQIVAAGFPGNPVDVAMLDNYFIVPDGGTITWHVSELNDGITWNALDTANFLSKPDQLRAVHTLKRRIYLFGQYSTEVWYDAGAADFAFRRDNNALFEHGVASPKTIREGFEIMLYLATNQDGAAGVMLVEGITDPLKISSAAIDLALEKFTPAELEDSEAILYRENGLTFYQLSFTSGNRTFVYVVETHAWHELSIPNGDRHVASSHAFFFGKHYIGTYNDDKLFELSYKFFTYNSELIRCIRIGAPFFEPDRRRIRVDRFELEAITGFPDGDLVRLNRDATDPPTQQLDELIKRNEDAEVILFVSRDGGKTFGNGRRASMGRYGQYGIRTIWNRLGTNKGRRIVFKLEFPYRLPCYIIGTYLIYSVLPE